MDTMNRVAIENVFHNMSIYSRLLSVHHAQEDDNAHIACNNWKKKIWKSSIDRSTNLDSSKSVNNESCLVPKLVQSPWTTDYMNTISNFYFKYLCRMLNNILIYIYFFYNLQLMKDFKLIILVGNVINVSPTCQVEPDILKTSFGFEGDILCFPTPFLNITPVIYIHINYYLLLSPQNLEFV